MIAYGVLGITFLLAIFCLLLLWRILRRRAGWPGILMVVSMAVFLYLYGAWVFLSVYLKYVFGAVFLVLFCIALAGRMPANASAKQSKARACLNLFFTIVFCVLSVLYFTGTTGKPYGLVNLSFPFKSGVYFVFQGGKGLPTNLFHYKMRSAIYAMDIVKLNNTGGRAKHIFSTRLEDYNIFGDTIYSPCRGRVRGTKDTNKDNVPPHLDRAPGSLNSVLIETDSYYVFLGHLKKGGIFVRAGDMVENGQPLGLAGNSGFSLEPHLHIQVQAKTDSSIPWYREKPLLIEFSGRSYLLFDVIRAKGSQ